MIGLPRVKPRRHLCGRHHRFMEMTRESARSVRFDRLDRSYLLIDADTLHDEKGDQ